MDPSKFSVRCTNLTMTRQERFSDASYLDLSKTLNDCKSSFRSDKYETNLSSWRTPRRTHPFDSDGSLEEDNSDKELRAKKSAKNLKTVQKLRASQHARRIAELSRPRLVVSRLPRTHENRSKVSERLKTTSEYKTSSQTDLSSVEDPVIAEKAISRHRKTADRIAKLAEPRIRDPIAINPLGKIDERALFAIASKRIVELATPRSFPTMRVAANEKQNPYSVKPEALKATCSPAIELLARPKNFGFLPKKSSPKK